MIVCVFRTSGEIFDTFQVEVLDGLLRRQPPLTDWYCLKVRSSKRAFTRAHAAHVHNSGVCVCVGALSTY